MRWAKSDPDTENPSRRFISVELEVTESSAGSTIDSACERHSVAVVEDGSLPDEGFELNTSPTSGARFCSMVREVCKALQDDGAKVDKACGYHVHVDARDFTYNDIINLIRVYARIESALFLCVAPSRRDNQYCKKCGEDFTSRIPAGHGQDEAEVVSNTVYKAGKSYLESAKGNKYDGARYTALNIHSWVYRGTVECRLHHGTIDPVKVINWAVLWAGILDWAKANESCHLPAAPWDALMEVAPTPAIREWLNARFDRFALTS